MKTTTTAAVNAELGRFVSLASDPTMLPTFTGITGSKPARPTSLVDASDVAWVGGACLAFAACIGQLISIW